MSQFCSQCQVTGSSRNVNCGSVAVSINCTCPAPVVPLPPAALNTQNFPIGFVTTTFDLTTLPTVGNFLYQITIPRALSTLPITPLTDVGLFNLIVPMATGGTITNLTGTLSFTTLSNISPGATIDMFILYSPPGSLNNFTVVNGGASVASIPLPTSIPVNNFFEFDVPITPNVPFAAGGKFLFYFQLNNTLAGTSPAEAFFAGPNWQLRLTNLT